MPAVWTGDLVGEMHNAGISARDLAKEMGLTPAYLSMILNGRREPHGAEEKLRAALERLKEQKGA
jgi:transcriptional regulator with XRE-family HTH domain